MWCFSVKAWHLFIISYIYIMSFSCPIDHYFYSWAGCNVYICCDKLCSYLWSLWPQEWPFLWDTISVLCDSNSSWSSNILWHCKIMLHIINIDHYFTFRQFLYVLLQTILLVSMHLPGVLFMMFFSWLLWLFLVLTLSLLYWWILFLIWDKRKYDKQ